MLNQIVAELESFVRSRFRIKSSDHHFNTDLNLWDEGYIDSVGAVQMVAHIEETYGIELTQEVLFDPDFTSISGIARLVTRLMNRDQQRSA